MPIRIRQTGSLVVYSNGALAGWPVSTGGPSGAVQFNTTGFFDGEAVFSYDKNNDRLHLSGSFTEGDGSIASGDYSHSEGSTTEASGQYSHAEGVGGIASGYGSHVEGYETLAIGNYSHAEGGTGVGGQLIASGTYSHAEGYNTIAHALGSHTEGYYTAASGDYSHAEGNSSTSSGEFSHAEGSGTTASGDYSHAEGNSTTASGQGSHASGIGSIASGTGANAEGEESTASGIGSHGEGYQTTASNDYSHAEGWSTTASGVSSHAEGRQTTASGDYSHAEGYLTTGSNDYSHAEGFRSLASGISSHAEGRQTVSAGNYSHAAGFKTLSSGDYSSTVGLLTTGSGDYSFAAGNGTIAAGDYQTAIGKWNTSDSSTNTLFIVGNGTSDASRDTILKVTNTQVQIFDDVSFSGLGANSISMTQGITDATTALSTNPIYWQKTSLLGSPYYWAIGIDSSENLHFYYGFNTTTLTAKGYLENGATGTDVEMNFTGQHRSVAVGNVSDYVDKIGLIVKSTGVYNPLSGSTISINDAVPVVDLTTTRNDKKCFGVISDAEDTESSTRTHSAGIYVTIYQKKSEDDNRLFVNSLGEGCVWVCNINGNLENGDYITTCEVPGYGMKQDDDLLHNYTVAKITCDCSFDLDSTVYRCEEFVHEGVTYRRAFVGCTYHCG